MEATAPKKRRLRCDQCQLARIQGVVCHEIGCPDAWKGSVKECKACGDDFRPKNLFQYRHEKYCYNCRR